MEPDKYKKFDDFVKSQVEIQEQVSAQIINNAIQFFKENYDHSCVSCEQVFLATFIECLMKGKKFKPPIDWHTNLDERLN